MPNINQSKLHANFIRQFVFQIPTITDRVWVLICKHSIVICINFLYFIIFMTTDIGKGIDNHR